MLTVPRRWSDLSPSWMTAALAGRCPGVAIDAVEVGSPAEGTNSGAPVRLTYRSGVGPASVFVKRAGRPVNRLALLALGALATEARLADSGVTLPVEHPLAYGGGVDWRRLAAVVVMDDVVAAGGRVNDARSPLSVAEVRSGLEGLARLHADFWGSRLPESLRFLRPWRLSGPWSLVSRVSLAHGLRKASDLEVAPHVLGRVGAGSLGRQFHWSAISAAAGAQSVLHGDPHPGNTYVSADGATGLLDWQLARVGHWSHDVGYFLVASLETADRRRYERELLAGYLEVLGGLGCDVPTWERAWSRFRATPAFGLATWLHTLSFGTFQPVDVCVATIARFAAAYDDLGTARIGRPVNRT